MKIIENASKMTICRKMHKDRMLPKWQYVKYHKRENLSKMSICTNTQKTECFQNDNLCGSTKERMFTKWTFARNNPSKMPLKWSIIPERFSTLVMALSAAVLCINFNKTLPRPVKQFNLRPEKSHWSGRLNTVYLRVLTSLD